jgi:flagellar biosynthesis protein FlhF
MNVQRFVARSAREALTQVRHALGEDAVIISNRSVAEGVEVLAMAGDAVSAIAQDAAPPAGRRAATPAARQQAVPAAPAEPEPEPEATDVDADVARMSMSTLSFQDFVRQRLHERRQRDAQPAADDFAAQDAPLPPAPPRSLAAAAPVARPAPVPAPTAPVQAAAPSAAPAAARPAEPRHAAPAATADARSAGELMAEIKAMKGMIEDQIGTMMWLDGARRQPLQAKWLRQLLSAGFSPRLAREVVERMPADYTESDAERWLLDVLVRNLHTDEAGIDERGGVYALVGPTGVGKTTTTAKLAASFALKHGAQQVGLITLDSYRVGAHDQLRAYGKILGLPVHVAHDTAALTDLLQLLSHKKLVLIDTVGMGQRDTRVPELLALLDQPNLKKLLVLNAAQQGETLEDVIASYRAGSCVGAVISKLDEAVTSGAVLDCLIRHGLTLTGVANGQRVPEDWHRPNARMLIHRALRGRASGAFSLQESDVGMMFSVKQAALGELHA